MLIAPIDRNKEPEPDKQISRINSPYWTLPANGGLGSPQAVRPPHCSEGVILRVRNTRIMERRKNISPPEPIQRERRIRDNRKHEWNTTGHHVLVIAIEASEAQLWKTGDRVSVAPKNQAAMPKADAHPPADTPKEKPPLLIKDEGDYVLHLSKPSPAER